MNDFNVKAILNIVSDYIDKPVTLLTGVYLHPDKEHRFAGPLLIMPVVNNDIVCACEFSTIKEGACFFNEHHFIDDGMVTEEKPCAYLIGWREKCGGFINVLCSSEEIKRKKECEK